MKRATPMIYFFLSPYKKIRGSALDRLLKNSYRKQFKAIRGSDRLLQLQM
jgi:hypothetical protein